MASHRETDTSLWLHNKLGISTDSWAGGSICSQLNPEVLKNIQECFVELQTQVKLKFLLSFFQFSRRNLEEWKTELEEILEVAVVDGDPWVAMVAEILKTYPATGALNMEIGSATDEYTRKIFNDLANDLRKLVPLRSRGIPRKMTDTTPLKGIPSRHIGGFASPLSRAGSTPTSIGALGSSPSAGPNRPSPRTLAGRKDGGIKLLDITEQPIGFAQAKKRKRQQELEAAQKAATESQATPANPSQPLSGEESETGSVTETPEKVTPTPDYAAGLLPSNPPPTPAAAVTPLATTSIPPLTPLKEPPRMTVVRPPAVPSISSLPSGSLASPAQVVRLVTSQPPAATSAATTVPTVYRLVQPAAAAGQPTATTTATNQPAAPPKKSVALMLTREQMQEAQEMFKNANKVTRPEKALILGFMAGSRENPCPHLGNIVTIKLSEDEEIVTAGDGITTTRIVETHFQMNYAAGEWKRIKKMRKMEETPASVATVLATATG
nr:EOG090X08WB [Daphnia magna]